MIPSKVSPLGRWGTVGLGIKSKRTLGTVVGGAMKMRWHEQQTNSDTP